METYEQMINQFANLIGFKHRKEWIQSLTLKQLKTFKEGLLNNGLRNSSFEHFSWTKTYIPIIDELINQKIIETRNWKINQLGIND